LKAVCKTPQVKIVEKKTFELMFGKERPGGVRFCRRTMTPTSLKGIKKFSIKQ